MLFFPENGEAVKKLVIFDDSILLRVYWLQLMEVGYWCEETCSIRYANFPRQSRGPASARKIFYTDHEKKAVKIGGDVWVGANCVILPG